MIALARDGVPDTSPSQILADLGETVAFVSDEALRTNARPTTSASFDSSLTHQLFKDSNLVALTGCQYEGHGLALSLDSHMDLRTEASLRAT